MSLITKRNVGIGAVVLGIPALILAWWLISPLFLDTEVNEAFPLSASAQVPDDMTQDEVEKEMESAATSDVVSEEPMPVDAGAPAVITTGTFRDADDFHMGSGIATIYELEDGSRILRLSEFEVTNGPDLHVLLVPNADPTGREDVEGYVDLGSLKGNIGDQNYEIPDDLDLSGFNSVVIYCQPFHVLFSVASLG